MTTYDIIKPDTAFLFAATLGRITAFGRAVEQSWENHCSNAPCIVMSPAAAPYEIAHRLPA